MLGGALVMGESGGMVVGASIGVGVGAGGGELVGVEVDGNDEGDIVGDDDGAVSSIGITCGLAEAVLAVLSVLPNPPEPRIVSSRERSTLNAGEAAFSKISWAILSPSLILNCFWLLLTRTALTSPL